MAHQPQRVRAVRHTCLLVTYSETLPLPRATLRTHLSRVELRGLGCDRPRDMLYNEASSNRQCPQKSGTQGNQAHHFAHCLLFTESEGAMRQKDRTAGRGRGSSWGTHIRGLSPSRSCHLDQSCL